MALAQSLPPKRQEDRFCLALPVRILFDETGANQLWSCTYEVSSRGVRLKRIPGIEHIGQEIWVQRNARKARYRVTWLGELGTPFAFQFGADCMESKLIWDNDLHFKLRAGA